MAFRGLVVFESSVIAAIKAHAIEEYPNESCGLVVAGEYVRTVNVAEEKRRTFRIAQTVLDSYRSTDIQAIVHSHPDGPDHPSGADMAQQDAMRVTWGVVTTDGKVATEPFWMGDDVPILPLKKRLFRHGVTDCYTIIRDCYKMGAKAIEEQGFKDWPFEQSIRLPVFPRDWAWWRDENLYAEGFPKAGFKKLNKDEKHEYRVGDVFLKKFQSAHTNHGGLYMGNGQVLHHIVTRYSRMDPVGPWAAPDKVDYWLRYDPDVA